MAKTTSTNSTEKIQYSLDTLGLKPIAQKVFIYLTEHGLSPVTDISFNLNIPKSSIYDALSELSEQSLVIEYSENRNKKFSVIDSAGIEKIINQKIESLKDAGSALLAFNSLHKSSVSAAKPKIKFYFGNEGIRQAFRDTTWNAHCHKTYLMWPTRDMIDVLTPEFSAWHSAQRLKYKVRMYIIRKESDLILGQKNSKLRKTNRAIDTLMESQGWKTDRDIRSAPKGIDWDMSFWVYDNKCLCASSGSEKFAFVVHSKEFAGLMVTLWKQVWEVSKPTKV